MKTDKAADLPNLGIFKEEDDEENLKIFHDDFYLNLSSFQEAMNIFRSVK